jgi:hypothetical protein
MATAFHTPSRRAALRLIAVVNGLALASALGFVATAAGSIQLRFVAQPNTTQTGSVIRTGFDSTGDPIQVEFYDPATGDRVSVGGPVTLSLAYNPAGATLTGGGTVSASKGVATFSNLRLNRDGAYKLRATSPAASNQAVTDIFVVADQLDLCDGTSCGFSALKADGNTYSTTPTTGTKGASYAASLNLGGLVVSCDFEPYNYPDDRQPNAVFVDYDDGGVSEKTIRILIGKKTVQATPDNAASAYRVCYASPDPFHDINGDWAPADTSDNGPSEYFGEIWYVGLLPDCSNQGPVAPCVLSWTASAGGDRLGVFLAPAGDPIYR